MAAATMTEDLSIAEILYQNFITDGPLSSSAHALKQNGALRPQRRKYPEDGNDLGVLDYVDRNLTGKEPNYLEPGLAAFVAGYLRQITFSAAFPKLAAEVREKIQFLSFMMHLTERVGGDFGPAYRYYCSLEQEMYAGKVSWRDSIGPVIVDIIERTLDEEAGRAGRVDASLSAMPDIKFELDKDDEDEDDYGMPVFKAEFEPQKVKGEEEGGSVTPPLGKKRGRPKMRKNSTGRKLGRPAKKRVKNGEAAAAAAAELVSCEKCPEQLKSLADLDRHLFEVHSEGSLCLHCGQSSATYEDYETHTETHSMPCPKCEEACLGLKSLREHIEQTHREQRPLEEPALRKEPSTAVKSEECPLCRKKVKFIAKHLTTCNGSPSKKTVARSAQRFACTAPGCRKHYVSAARLRRHKERDHEADSDYVEEDSDGGGEKSAALVQCHICPVKTTGQAMDRHMFDEHGVGSFCEKCGIKANSFKEYEKHMEMHEVTCPQCPKLLFGIRSLRRHMTTHHKDESLKEEKVTCDLCGKSLLPCSLQAHIKLTHGEVNISCSKCDFKTNRRESLRIHWRVRHTESWEQCPVCGKKVKKHLKRHLATCGKQYEKTVPCITCLKKFTTEERMRAHNRKVHFGKNHVCDFCAYRTYSSFNLRLHLNKMHNAPSLQAVCPVCQTKTYSLDWHIRVVHPVYFDEQQEQKVELSTDVDQSTEQLS